MTVESQKARLGLALSGGGFRAAFFHIGVLARMAELDLLSQVEVLSTVSGGSVVGAMYYLKVRRLLQDQPDAAIKTAALVRLVKGLEKGFYDGVKRNLRMRVYANFFRNVKFYGRRYSRSDRIGELYTHYFFSPYVEEKLRPAVFLRNTTIQPKNEPPDFKPFGQPNDTQTPNDRRRHKVPVLLINSTTLNTGHNFRFTSTWMGEVPSTGPQEQIDQNTRLRRFYIDDRDKVPEKYRKLPLGIAVAASTSVPGIFPPLALTDLYEEWTPQLVDGGVHDNQGVEGLLDCECTHLIISDACGQMEDEPEPARRLFRVLSRSSSILQDRIREEEYEGAMLRRSSRGSVRDVVFLHMQQGLERPEKTWIGGTRQRQDEGAVLQKGSLKGEVDERVQASLSEVRTDLDSFTEVEAQALMAEGYLIAKSHIPPDLTSRIHPARQPQPVSRPPDWGFLQVLPAYLKHPDHDQRFLFQLRMASKTVFKVLWLIPWLGGATLTLAVVIVAAWFYYLIVFEPNHPVALADWIHANLRTYRALGITLLTLILYGLLFLVPRTWRRLVFLRSLPYNLVFKLGAATALCLGVWIHLLVFDRLYLWQGRVKRLRKLPRV